jgi:ribonuclease VapC
VIVDSLAFGKGRHPARLNFGDCLTYATVKLAEEPLLCLGDDFAKTDLQLVRKAESKR